MTLVLTLLLAAPVNAQSTAPTTPTTQAPTAPAPVAPATAPAQPVGTVQDIVIIGTTDVLSEFLKATLTVQPGTSLTAVNLRSVEQEVTASGYFQSAKAELRSVGGRDILQITVVANPTIKEVAVTGLTFLNPDAFKKSLEDLLNIAPGATLNAERIQQAKEALSANYRNEGFPFQPNISTTETRHADGTVTITFVVDETAPINRIEVTGATLLPRSTIVDIFKPLYDSRKFTTQAYFEAVQRVGQAYNAAGVLLAGVNPTTTVLEGGVLKVDIIESRVAGIDVSYLNAENAAALESGLQTRVGQPITIANLQADVRTLSNRTGKSVGFDFRPDPANPNQVTVLFGADEIATGPVKTIVVKGNTLIPTEKLLAAIDTKVGDTYTLRLAQNDFMSIRDVYRKAGYEISTRDAITFEDGQLTFNIREVYIGKYEIAWKGNHNTQDRVITRELPPVGQPFNANVVRDTLGRISRLGFVRPVDFSTRSDDPNNPESVTAIVTVAESDSGIPVNLNVGYDSLSGGWSGEAGYSNENVFGLAHKFSARLSIQQNDAGQNFAGRASYAIPWLDVDFLDFRQVPTQVSVEVGTEVSGNNTITTKATVAGTNPATGEPVNVGDNLDTYWDYTQRHTFFGVEASRPLMPNLRGSVGIGVSYRSNYLEPFRESDAPFVQGSTTTRVPVTTTEAQALALMPPESLTTNFSVGLRYDSTDSLEFPTQGWRANTNAMYTIGRSGDTPVSWTEVQGGVSTYYGFGNNLIKEEGYVRKQQVFAVRANAGTLFGNYLPGSSFVVGGGSGDTPRQIRGIPDASLRGTNYFTSSAEYRVDFGLNNSVAQGLFGVIFADAGSAWGSEANPNFNLYYGFGAGLQLDLGFGDVRLPSLRFDYGFSPQDGSGRFYFRLGNFW